MSTKAKRGTIGWEVAKLVKRYGHYTGGHIIVNMALEQMTQESYIRFGREAKSITETAGFKAAELEEKQAYGRMGIVFYSAEHSVAKKYTPDGRVVAIRFAPGMTEEAMRESVERDPLAANEWRAYDESTNTFLS